MFGMRVVPARYEMLMKDKVTSNPNLALAWEQLDEVDTFSYLGNSILPDCHISDEVSRRTQ